MKNAAWLFLLVFLLNACGTDPEAIIGRWQIESSISMESCLIPGTVDYVEGCNESTNVTTCIVTEFTSLGEYKLEINIMTFGSTLTDTREGTYTFDGNDITISLDGLSSSGTAEIDGFNLIIDGEDGSACRNISTYTRLWYKRATC